MGAVTLRDCVFTLEDQIRKALNADGDLEGEIDRIVAELESPAAGIKIHVHIAGPGPRDANISTINSLRSQVGLEISRSAAEEWRAADPTRADILINITCRCANCENTGTVP